MTLILAVPAQGGVVLASDAQVTSGEVRSRGEKLFRLTSHCAWGASGEVALIQRVREAIEAVSTNQPLEQLRDQLANAIKQCVDALLRLDFRTQFFTNNPDALLSLHPGDFVFAECRSKPLVLHVTSYGTPEWTQGPFATGSGEPFAYALIEKYEGSTLSLEQAGVLACKVIEEAIEVGAYGLGPPIHVWHVTPDGIDRLDDARVAALADAARMLREEEVRLLVASPNASSDASESGESGT